MKTAILATVLSLSMIAPALADGIGEVGVLGMIDKGTGVSLKVAQVGPVAAQVLAVTDFKRVVPGVGLTVDLGHRISVGAAMTYENNRFQTKQISPFVTLRLF